MNTLKTLGLALTWWVILLAFAWTLGGCATTVSKKQNFMERAYSYDETYKDHPNYYYCVGQFELCLIANCQGQADVYNCAHKCLDEAEECLNGSTE